MPMHHLPLNVEGVEMVVQACDIPGNQNLALGLPRPRRRKLV